MPSLFNLGAVIIFMYIHPRSALKNGYVCTIAGRRRYLPDITSKDAAKRKYAERQAVNSVVQGSASDIIKSAMLEVQKALLQSPALAATPSRTHLQPTLILQVHDELIYDVPTEFMSSGAPASTSSSPEQGGFDFVQLLQECMDSRVRAKFDVKIPLLVKVKTGTSWGNIT
jgi:DNA polymerase I-like protein with 3'-5' exonuclease and polymerase domains